MHRGIDCRSCQDGFRNLRKIWWNQYPHRLEVTADVLQHHLVRNFQPAKAPKGKNNLFPHFPQHPNCEMCKRPKVTGAVCRWNSQSQMPRATKFGDILTVGPTFLNEDGESWKNRRYAIVVHDLATQWTRSYPCNRRKSKVCIHTDISVEFGKACQVPQWNHCASTLHRPATAGTAERAVRGFKEGTSSILLQSGFGERWWAESMDCYGHSRNVQDLFSMGELHMDGDSRNNSVGQSYHSERKSNIIRYQQQIRRGSIRSARKHSQASLWVTLHMRGEAGKETY